MVAQVEMVALVAMVTQVVMVAQVDSGTLRPVSSYTYILRARAEVNGEN